MRTLLAICLLALSGCAQGDGELAGILRSLQGQRGPSVDLRAAVTPEAVAELPGPALFVELQERGTQSVVLFASENGGFEQWASTDRVTISLRRGILSATRGLGGDLMIADVSDVEQGLFGARAQGERVHRYLDGENQEIRRAFVCDYIRLGTQTVSTVLGSVRATGTEETCTTVDGSFVNEYWSTGGRFVKSRQWVGPDVGYMIIEELRR